MSSGALAFKVIARRCAKAQADSIQYRMASARESGLIESFELVRWSGEEVLVILNAAGMAHDRRSRFAEEIKRAEEIVDRIAPAPPVSTEPPSP